MSRQKPTVTTPEQAEAALKADGSLAGSGAAGYLNGQWATARQRRLTGETQAQAQARWAREREIEADRDGDPRLVGNQVLPIHYD